MAGRSPHFSRPSAIAAAMAGDPIALRPNLRDVSTRQLIGKPLTGHSGWITSVAFNLLEAARPVASGSVDWNTILLDAAKERPTKPIQRSAPASRRER